MSGLKKPKVSPAKPDDEISQIMSEIEELQQEMSADPVEEKPKTATQPKLKAVPSPEPSEAPPSEDPLEEFRTEGTNDADLDASLGDLSDDGQAAGGGLLDQVIDEAGQEAGSQAVAQAGAEEAGEPETHVEKVEESMHDDQGNSDEGCLTMTLTGKMALKLKYECGGQEVTVAFGEECLRVQLADGTEFKVPVGQKTLRRVA